MKLKNYVSVQRSIMDDEGWTWQGFISEVNFYSVRENWDATSLKTICLKVEKWIKREFVTNA